MTGLDTICPSLTTGLWTTLCIPRMADWGGLIKGVDMIDPKIPPALFNTRISMDRLLLKVYHLRL